jgi:hypothetical protein
MGGIFLCVIGCSTPKPAAEAPAKDTKIDPELIECRKRYGESSSKTESFWNDSYVCVVAVDDPSGGYRMIRDHWMTELAKARDSNSEAKRKLYDKWMEEVKRYTAEKCPAHLSANPIPVMGKIMCVSPPIRRAPLFSDFGSDPN